MLEKFKWLDSLLESQSQKHDTINANLKLQVERWLKDKAFEGKINKNGLDHFAHNLIELLSKGDSENGE